jgi:hypothetical protein
MDSRAARLRSCTCYSANSARNGPPIHAGCVVDKQTPTYSQTIIPNKVCPYKVDVSRKVFIGALLLVPICLVPAGISHLVSALEARALLRSRPATGLIGKPTQRQERKQPKS